MTTIILDFLLLLFSVLSLLHLVRSKYWLFEISTYFSQQFFWVLISLSLIRGFVAPITDVWSIVVLLISVLLGVYHFIKFLPYTRLGRKDIPNKSRNEVDETVSLMVSNVLIENRDFHRLAKIVNEVQPDVLVVLETDEEWLDELVAQIDTSLYPNRVLKPQENGYGLGLFTKRTIIESEIEQVSDVPSLRVRIEDGRDGEILMFVVHPRPPVPGEAETSWPKDRELLYVANAVKESPIAKVIVLGDMNEVAWSKTSRRFLQISGLKDPRKGRHILPTFPSYLPMLSFPLDHIFCSDHFGVVEYKRLPSIGSDHFPLFIELGYGPPVDLDSTSG